MSTFLNNIISTDISTLSNTSPIRNKSSLSQSAVSAAGDSRNKNTLQGTTDNENRHGRFQLKGMSAHSIPSWVSLTMEQDLLISFPELESKISRTEVNFGQKIVQNLPTAGVSELEIFPETQDDLEIISTSSASSISMVEQSWAGEDEQEGSLSSYNDDKAETSSMTSLEIQAKAKEISFVVKNQVEEMNIKVDFDLESMLCRLLRGIDFLTTRKLEQIFRVQDISDDSGAARFACYRVVSKYLGFPGN